MEMIVDGIFSGLSRVLKFFVFDMLLEGVCYFVGRFTLLAFTLGRYPRGHYAESHEGRITLFGFVVTVILPLVFIAMSN